MNDKEIISKAMRLLRMKNTPAQRRASRINADKAWRARWKNHVPKLKKTRKVSA